MKSTLSSYTNAYQAGSDIRWPRWRLLTQKKVLRAVNQARGEGGDDLEEEELYNLNSGRKVRKRRAKRAQGANGST